jgi:integrase
MSRPRKNEAPDLTLPADLTAGAIERLSCPPGKQQAFLRDAKAPGLRVRVTAAGAKSFVFEAKLNRQTIRRTIGDERAWTIEQARAEANRLRVTLDAGLDPRELDLQKLAEREQRRADAEAQREQQQREAATVREAWDVYMADRKPQWRERTYADHIKIAQAGGEPHARRKGVKTKPGPLAELMPLPLREMTPARVESWAAKEAQTRPARVRLALRVLKAFLRWCATHDDYKTVADATAASSKRARESAGKMTPGRDVLQREQLPAWFAHVRQIQNPVISAYLQCVLLTGARREEFAALRWDDLNLRWNGVHMGDKVEDGRQVPLTPYVKSLLTALPRRNQWVFSSPTAKSGRLAEPSIAHRQACAAAGIEGLTLHGLRRSFGTLSEWLEIPAGVVAQIQGHKPSATAEKHYRVRPLDLLRVHHERIEAWMLEQGGVHFTPKAEPGKLVAVK